MRKDLMEILRCPACRGELRLVPTASNPEEILEGRLDCPRCRRSFPIHDGIPDLLVPDPRHR